VRVYETAAATRVAFCHIPPIYDSLATIFIVTHQSSSDDKRFFCCCEHVYSYTCV